MPTKAYATVSHKYHRLNASDVQTKGAAPSRVATTPTPHHSYRSVAFFLVTLRPSKKKKNNKVALTLFLGSATDDPDAIERPTAAKRISARRGVRERIGHRSFTLLRAIIACFVVVVCTR